MEKTGRVWSAKEKNRAPQLAIRLVEAHFSTARAPSCGATIFPPAGPSPNLDRKTLELWRKGRVGSVFLWQTDFRFSTTRIFFPPAGWTYPPERLVEALVFFLGSQPYPFDWQHA